MFAETEMAQALREIRTRDASFDMPKFLTLLKNDVPRVIRAYLENDAAVLKEHCSPEMVERLTGIMTAQHAEVRFLWVHPVGGWPKLLSSPSSAWVAVLPAALDAHLS